MTRNVDLTVVGGNPAGSKHRFDADDRALLQFRWWDLLARQVTQPAAAVRPTWSMCAMAPCPGDGAAAIL
ncbi:MAG: hypothetical protein ACLSWY_07655 [Ruthenibacterium lactatiformans]